MTGREGNALPSPSPPTTANPTVRRSTYKNPTCPDVAASQQEGPAMPRTDVTGLVDPTRNAPLLLEQQRLEQERIRELAQQEREEERQRALEQAQQRQDRQRNGSPRGPRQDHYWSDTEEYKCPDGSASARWTRRPRPVPRIAYVATAWPRVGTRAFSPEQPTDGDRLPSPMERLGATSLREAYRMQGRMRRRAAKRRQR